ncbi:MAG: F0F1 ATP synthase subunit delta [Campylobacterota bacterium]|nr:F0F1 ATP synthase subunit delta [Campylobacterota bacterium]
MIELVAKRYAKALMKDRNIESLTSINNELKTISSAYNDEKFLLIITSTEIENNKKIDLILSFVENCSQDVQNLIRVLSEKKRLNLIPEIVKELNIELSILNNSYTGIVYTGEELSDEEMDKLNTQFAKKFNVTLKLTQDICGYDGIKVEIDGLGVEIGFTKSRLKSQMINHILKAV